MTLFEIARYIPLGSEVTAFGWDDMRSKPDPQKQNRGILVALKYGCDGTGHTAVLLQQGCEKSYLVEQIAHIRIETQPKDYDIGKDELTVENAAWARCSLWTIFLSIFRDAGSVPVREASAVGMYVS